MSRPPAPRHRMPAEAVAGEGAFEVEVGVENPWRFIVADREVTGFSMSLHSGALRWVAGRAR